MTLDDPDLHDPDDDIPRRANIHVLAAELRAERHAQINRVIGELLALRDRSTRRPRRRPK